MWAMSSGAGAGNAVLGWVSMQGSSMSMTVRSHPCSRPACAVVVTAATGAASATMNSMRAAGTAGSIGRYAAPVLSTARIATIASADRENSSATHAPGPHQSSQQVRQPVRRLIELAVRHRAALKRHRYRLGGARHLVGEHHGDRHRRHGLGQHRSVAELIQPGVLASSSRSMDNNRRVGLAVMINPLDQWSWPPTPAGTARSVFRCWPRRTRACRIRRAGLIRGLGGLALSAGNGWIRCR